ncbi:MAG: hypothetical protein AB7D51_07970 [Desulfovibrionaceae bacterium]
MLEYEVLVRVRDRRGWLMALGGVLVLAGGLCLLLGVYMTREMLARPAYWRNHYETWHYLLLWGALGPCVSLCVWLGIGCILVRRWARAVLRVVSLLYMSLFPLQVAALVLLWGLSKALDVELASLGWALLGAVLVFLLHAAMFLFLGSLSVSTTVKRRDPVERWVDRTPEPVVAMTALHALGLLIGAVLVAWFSGVLGIPGSTSPAMPAFGLALTGWAAAAHMAATCAVQAYFCWHFALLRVRGVWGLMAFQVFGLASVLVTWLVGPWAELFPGLAPERAASSGNMQMVFGVVVSTLMLSVYGGLYRRVFRKSTDRTGE